MFRKSLQKQVTTKIQSVLLKNCRTKEVPNKKTAFGRFTLNRSDIKSCSSEPASYNRQQTGPNKVLALSLVRGSDGASDQDTQGMQTAQVKGNEDRLGTLSTT